MKKLFLSILSLLSAGANADVLYSAESHPEEFCLAQNIYFEARGSTLADQAAVADVVLNRVDDKRFPNTVCEVVRDGFKEGRKDCQFSWYCDGKSDYPKDTNAWIKAKDLSYRMMNKGHYRGITEGATNYHADYVYPSWAKKIELIGRIGDHIFYRWN
jgi:spore germination cell wall hydrolase CwlJ-like protein